VLVNQVRLTLDVLYRSTDPTVFYQPGVHLGSLLSPLLAPVAVLGLAWGLRNVADWRFAVLGLWFWGGLLAPVLTTSTPSVQRLVGAWPALMLFPAVLLNEFTWRMPVGRPRRMWIVVLIVVVGAIAMLDTREYFISYRASAPYADATAQARRAAERAADYRIFQLGIDTRGVDVFLGYGSTRFFAKGVDGADLGAPADQLPLLDAGGKGLAFFVYPSNAVFLPMLRLFYPGAHEEPVACGGGSCFTEYLLEPSVVARSRMLRVAYTMPGGRQLERREPNLGTIGPRGTADSWIPPESLLYPARVTWQGAFIATEAGPTRFTVSGDGNAELWVDDRLVTRETKGPPDEAVLVLARGLHAVRLSGTLRRHTNRVTVLWAAPGALLRPPTPRLLWATTYGGFSGEVWGGETRLDTLPGRAPDSRRLDPFLAFREAHHDRTIPTSAFVARWRAGLNVPEAGPYEFFLSSNGPSSLSVDRGPAVDVPAGSHRTLQAWLAAGQHTLEVRYGWAQGRAHLELGWTRSHGIAELIPPSALSPVWRSGFPGEPIP
jgi:hypothetical protein